jgi:hypothetical protein
MPRLIIIALTLAIATLAAAPARAQELIESYRARLSENDHYNSNGVRLTSAAAIIRQDRANFFRFGHGDAEDEADRFFASFDNRAALERMLERGHAQPGVLSRIVNGTPLVRVDIYRDGGGVYIRVTLLD